MRHGLIPLMVAAAAGLACVTAPVKPSTIAAEESTIAVDEIVGVVAHPGSGTSPIELRAAGDFFYRAGNLDDAWDSYRACSSDADGQLRAACHWGMGAVRVASTRRTIAKKGLHEDESCIRRDPPAPLECTEEAQWFDTAMSMLRLAHRRHPTARRAFVIGTLYEELGDDAEASKFYEQALAIDPDDDRLSRAAVRLRSRGPRPACPSCPPQAGVEFRPRDCPTLPFDWHRRTGELEVVGSEIEGETRERVLACFGEPRKASADVWSYEDHSCTKSRWAETTTVRLHFEGDVVDTVTHERVIHDRTCPWSWF
jgi:tetratricopeptide (TPR) repeat protein